MSVQTRAEAWPRSSRLEWILHFALLVVLVLVFFLPVVIHPEDFLYPSYAPYTDLTTIHWPNAKELVDEHQDYGLVPLWKNVGLSGMPAIANQLAMLFYPLNYLLLVLPIDAVFNVFVLVHFLIAGIGLYLYLRLALRQSGLPALVAAALFMFSGKLIAHVAAGQLSVIAAFVCLPWLFLGVHWAVARRSLMASLLTGVALALQVVTHTQILIYSVYLLILYAAFELWLARRNLQALAEQSPEPRGADGMRGNVRHLCRDALILLPVPMVALALGAVQILPLVELARYSDRALSLAQASEYALTVPQLLAGVLLSAVAGHEYTIYPGLVTLGLALLALLSRRDRPRVAFFIVAVGLALILSVGSEDGLLAVLYWVAPGWRFIRAAARAWLFLSFALAVLAGYGLDYLYSAEGPHLRLSRRTLTVASALVFGCVVLAAGLIVMYGHWSRATVALALAPVALLAVVGLRASGRLSPTVALALLLCLGLADLWTFDHSVLRTVTPEAAFADHAGPASYVSEKKVSEGLFRTYSPSYSIPVQQAARYGLQMADGVEPVHLKRYDEFMALAGGYRDTAFSVTIPPFPQASGLDAFRNVAPDPRLLGLLNVGYVLADFPVRVDGLALDTQIGSTYIYTNTLALPRAFLVGMVETAPDGPSALKATTTVDLGRVAVVEGPATALVPVVPPGTPPGGAVGGVVPARVLLYSANKIVTEVTLGAPALLVLSEMAYPGWRAYDNGLPIPIRTADYLLRAVELDPGQHTVAWVYYPPSLQWGLRITSIGAVLVLMVLVVLARQRAMRAGVKL